MSYRDQPHYVYRLLGPRGRVIYVGCTMDLERRVAEHRRDCRPAHAFARVDVEGPFDYATARRVERQRIEERAGRHNREWAPGFVRGKASVR